MGMLVGLVVGYLLGARTSRRDLGQLSQSLKALAGTDEFGEVIAAARSHVGQTLRELATLVDRDGAEAEAAPSDPSVELVDLVDRVKHIVNRA
jgi:hypothetical protein